MFIAAIADRAVKLWNRDRAEALEQARREVLGYYSMANVDRMSEEDLRCWRLLYQEETEILYKSPKKHFALPCWGSNGPKFRRRGKHRYSGKKPAGRPANGDFGLADAVEGFVRRYGFSRRAEIKETAKWLESLHNIGPNSAMERMAGALKTLS